MKVAFVDDNEDAVNIQKEYLARAALEIGLSCEATVFSSGSDFLEHYGCAFDVLFLGIEMPHLNGLETARQVRKLDQQVCIIFMANMSRHVDQYAVQGYSVNATDFVIKPVKYDVFLEKFKKAVRLCARSERQSLVLTQEDRPIRLLISSIYYLEQQKTDLIYHTEQGDFREQRAIADRETALSAVGFFKCTNDCMVNLHYVERVAADTVRVDRSSLRVSQQYRIPLIEALRALGLCGRPSGCSQHGFV